MARVGEQLSSTGSNRRLWGLIGCGALGLAFAVFVVAAGYQAALVLRILNWGHRGHVPPGHRIVLLTWLVMVLAGLGLFAVRLGIALHGEFVEDSGAADRAASAMHLRRLLPLLSLAAAAVVVIGFYAPDPYYLNTNGSVEDGGTVSRTAIVFVIAVSTLASVVTRFSPRRGLVVTAVALWWSAVILAAEGTNH
jgi:hypothetical protein